MNWYNISCSRHEFDIYRPGFIFEIGKIVRIPKFSFFLIIGELWNF